MYTVTRSPRRSFKYLSNVETANLKNFEVPVLLPGVKINTSASDFYPVEQIQLGRFDGKRWVLFGDVLGK